MLFNLKSIPVTLCIQGDCQVCLFPLFRLVLHLFLFEFSEYSSILKPPEDHFSNT